MMLRARIRSDGNRRITSLAAQSTHSRLASVQNPLYSLVGDNLVPTLQPHSRRKYIINLSLFTL